MAGRGSGAATNDFLERTSASGLPSVSGTFSWSAWIYRVGSASGSVDGVLVMFGEDSTNLDWYLCGCTDGGVLQLFTDGTTYNGSTISDATWYHLFCTKAAGTGAWKLYLDGVLDISGNGDVDVSATPSTLCLFDLAPDPVNAFNGRIAAFKFWDANLDGLAEQERWSYEAYNRDNLYLEWPMIDASAANLGVDISGNGRAGTVNGTLTVEDGPPILWNAQRHRKTYIFPAAGGGGTARLTQGGLIDGGILAGGRLVA